MDFTELWHSCVARYEEYQSRRTDESDWIKLFDDILLAARMIDSLGLFSPNETLEDCLTSSLPYIRWGL